MRAFFNYYGEVHSTTVLAPCGPTFWARPRCRNATVSFVLLQITCGFVLRHRGEVYSMNFTSFRHRLHAVQNLPVLNFRPPSMCGAGTTYRNASSHTPYNHTPTSRIASQIIHNDFIQKLKTQKRCARRRKLDFGSVELCTHNWSCVCIIGSLSCDRCDILFPKT